MRLQLQRIHVHHHLPVLAAKRRRHGGAGNARHLVAHRELPQIAQFGLAQPLALQGHQTYGQARCVEFHHDRRQCPLRQIAQTRHRQIRNARHIRIGIRPRLEIHLDQTHARQRTRFHVVHARRQGEHALELAGDVVLHLLRRHPGIKGRHHHHWNVDRRKQIHRHPHQAGDTDHAGDETDDDDQIRQTDGKARHAIKNISGNLTRLGGNGPA